MQDQTLDSISQSTEIMLTCLSLRQMLSLKSSVITYDVFSQLGGRNESALKSLKPLDLSAL
jgi:hypothetical protein